MVFLGPSAPLVRVIEGAVLTGVFERSRTAIEEIEAAHPAKPLGLARIPPWNWIVYPEVGPPELVVFKVLSGWTSSTPACPGGHFLARDTGWQQISGLIGLRQPDNKGHPCRAALAMIGTVLRHIECPNNPPLDAARGRSS